MSKKASLIHVYNILNKYSDETHRLTRKQIEQYLLLEYDCELNRKTLHDHLQTLNDCGCDIHFATSAKDGYFLSERLFEPSEIHLLCNAIYASHFIPEKASNDLIQKLLATQSQYMKKDFNKTVYMRNMRKTQNKEFFLNIELLTEAIQQNHPVIFDYMKYDINKSLVKRKEHAYYVHPYYMIYANENYYLICKNDKYDNLSHYRIDKMKHISIDVHATRKQLQNSFDPYNYAKSKFYMYGGEEERITLKCKYRMLDDIIDRFGSDISLQPFDDEHFLAIITSSRQGIIYFCLQYLQYCEVTAPLEVKQEIANILKHSLTNYTV